MEIIILCGFAFLAGLIDAMVGGGGLVQVPALFIFAPQMAGVSVLATNQFSSFGGTLFALGRYARKVPIDWKLMGVMGVVAAVASLLGARTISYVPEEVLRPMVFGLLVFVLIFTLLKKNFGLHDKNKPRSKRQWAKAVLIGALLGFYGGVFGPGFGTLTLFAIIGLMGRSFLKATAETKVANVAVNIGALAFFTTHGHVIYAIGLPMVLCNMTGSFLGTKLAMVKGDRFIRIFFLLIIVALLARLGYEIWD